MWLAHKLPLVHGHLGLAPYAKWIHQNRDLRARVQEYAKQTCTYTRVYTDTCSL